MSRTADYFNTGSTGSGRRWETSHGPSWTYQCGRCGWHIALPDMRDGEPDCGQCRNPTTLIAWPGM